MLPIVIRVGAHLLFESDATCTLLKRGMLHLLDDGLAGRDRLAPESVDLWPKRCEQLTRHKEKAPMALQVDGFVPLIQVFDMPRALAFYRDVLGFEVVSRSAQGDGFDWGMLRLKDTLLMLNTAYEKASRPAAPAPARVAAHKDTALFFDCPDPDSAYEHFRTLGMDVRAPVITGYGMKQVYVTDPDGYQLCFQCQSHEAQ